MSDVGHFGKDFARDFAHHPPRDEDEARQHEAVRKACEGLARTLDTRVPQGREKSVMFTHLETAMFWANAGIARARYARK